MLGWNAGACVAGVSPTVAIRLGLGLGEVSHHKRFELCVPAQTSLYPVPHKVSADQKRAK